MQDKPNNKEDHFLEFSAQKINLPLSPSLNKDPFPCLHSKATFPKFYNIVLFWHLILKIWGKTSVFPYIIPPPSTIKHARVGKMKQTKG